METIELIKKEHEELKKYISELKNIINNKFDINEFVNVYKKFIRIWMNHEKNEEKFFKDFLQKEMTKDMTYEHKALQGYTKIINLALETHYDPYIKITLDIDGNMFMNSLSRHIKKEEELLDRINQNLVTSN